MLIVPCPSPVAGLAQVWGALQINQDPRVMVSASLEEAALKDGNRARLLINNLCGSCHVVLPTPSPGGTARGADRGTDRGTDRGWTVHGQGEGRDNLVGW